MADHRILASLISTLVPSDGNRGFPGWGVTLVRLSQVPEHPDLGVLSSSVCLVAQGAKRVRLNGKDFDYDEDHLIVSSVDVPVSYRLTRASVEAPFLCLRLALDPVKIAPLAAKVFPKGLQTKAPEPSIGLMVTDSGITDTACRLVGALSDPADDGLLAGLVYDELLVRLLRSSLGRRIAQITIVDSAAVSIARAVSWLRSHFAQAVRVEELAELSHMSVSSFHQHFRAVTAQSPLQYQKALRLQEARNLLLAENVDAGTAALQVGYASQSQFTREYGRYFGQSPLRDVAQVKGQLSAVGA